MYARVPNQVSASMFVVFLCYSCTVYIVCCVFQCVLYCLSVCRFLAEVSTYSDTNKMTVENLAIVFAPIILRSNAASMDQMAVLNELNTCKLIVKMLILDELSGVKIEPKTENEYQKESAVTSDDIAYMMDSLSASSSSTASDNGVSPLPSPHTSNSSVGRVRLNLNTREKRATRNVTVNQTDEL